MKNADSAVPPIPAPKMPVAKPRRLGWYQLFTNGMPAAKLVPAIPRKKPITTMNGKLFICPATATRSTNGAESRSSPVNITRPPKRGVSTPTTMRPSEPTRIGTAISTDFCVGSRPISFS